MTLYFHDARHAIRAGNGHASDIGKPCAVLYTSGKGWHIDALPVDTLPRGTVHEFTCIGLGSRPLWISEHAHDVWRSCVSALIDEHLAGKPNALPSAKHIV